MTCHNMPRCQHFLAGHCGRDNCPYPHIKVSDSAPLCLDLLKGFCSLGDQCAKRHQAICPSFEKGTCSRGKYCPYPHPKSKSDEKLKGKFKYLKRKPQPEKHVEKVSHSNLRYFEDVNLQKENEIQLTENLEKTVKDNFEEDEERSHPFKNRPRLGSLPSFIPLSFDDSIIEDNTAQS
ncbi:hypothetical protein J6590_012782 [Homalodisca vitripennis]|nr:hypothetical protein J6590_012782 [Homalodisca vitripennis]